MMWYALLLLGLHAAAATVRQDDDLMSFVTLPDVRALRFDITHIDRERQAPGYWFVAPYGQIEPEHQTQKFQQYQVGPYIYDNDGMLIWAGSPLFDNRNIFDFKVNWNIDSEPRLSFILQHEVDNSHKGSGIILNKHYEIEHDVGVVNDLGAFNMHEFNILDGGKTALACTYRDQVMNMADLGRPNEESWVVTGGFVELDIESAEIVSQWDSFDQIPLHESVKFNPWDGPYDKPGSDYVHINAVDKNAVGDYIISMRFTNTIYYISGTTREIVWRLGGQETDFDQDFTFSKQHDVKFVESNGTHHTISFMNNASDELEAGEEVSSALFVTLDTTASPMTAHVIKRVNRPDLQLTRLRGNVQQLPNGNTFVGWSQWGYQTEHAGNGDLLLSAQFASERFSSYRSYKFDWTGQPASPPDLVASVYGTQAEHMVTICHISWNGATEVAGWQFYARAFDRGQDVAIGYVNKTDFETMYIAEGFMDWVSAEAIDHDGNVLGTSRVLRTKVPSHWAAAGFESSSDPSPDNPITIHASGEDPGGSDEAGDRTSELTVYADTKEVAKAVYHVYSVLHVFEAMLVVGSLCCVAGILAGGWFMLRRRRMSSYKSVPSEDPAVYGGR